MGFITRAKSILMRFNHNHQGPVGEAVAPTRLLTAGLLVNLLLKGAMLVRCAVVVLLRVKRLPGDVLTIGAAVDGGRVLLGRGGKVTLKASMGDGVVVLVEAIVS